MLADKINHFEPPTTKVGAMLNLNFVVALYLSRRSNLVSEYESGLHDPQVLALASRGAFQFTPEARDMSVEFQLSDGRRVLAEGKSESGELPLMKDRRLAKFETLAGRTLGPRADALRGACLNLPSVSSMRAWAARYL